MCFKRHQQTSSHDWENYFIFVLTDESLILLKLHIHVFLLQLHKLAENNKISKLHLQVSVTEYVIPDVKLCNGLINSTL